MIAKMNGKTEEGDKVNRGKRKRPKGPNPLSCKKKKGDEVTKKKKKTKKTKVEGEEKTEKAPSSETKTESSEPKAVSLT